MATIEEVKQQLLDQIASAITAREPEAGAVWAGVYAAMRASFKDAERIVELESLVKRLQSHIENRIRMESWEERSKKPE